MKELYLVYCLRYSIFSINIVTQIESLSLETGNFFETFSYYLEKDRLINQSTSIFKIRNTIKIIFSPCEAVSSFVSDAQTTSVPDSL